MNRYCIEIICDSPPKLLIGDTIAGGQVVGVRSDEPDSVSALWLSNKTGLSKSTITTKLAVIAQGSKGKRFYPRLQALAMLSDDTPKKGRPRKY